MMCLVVQRNDSRGVALSLQESMATKSWPIFDIGYLMCHILLAAGGRKLIRATVCGRSVGHLGGSRVHSGRHLQQSHGGRNRQMH